MPSVTLEDIVDPATQEQVRRGNASLGALSKNVYRDMQAPPRSLVTYRDGPPEYFNSERVLEGKHVVLFFGSNDPFSNGFVRTLRKVYSACLSPMEVVYISADRERRDFERFARQMPWYSLPFRNNKHIFERYEIKRVPAVVLVSNSNEIVYPDWDFVKYITHHVKLKMPAALDEVMTKTRAAKDAVNRFSSLFY
mmetsp:Transcript_761/g.1201  ORF Transcript_761/g.1201 Transcript_761/m.1201 type:complete len:195 (-) Transcript_761:100-684(-)